MATNKSNSKKSKAIAQVVTNTEFADFEFAPAKEAEVLEYLSEFPVTVEDFWKTHQRPIVAGVGMIVPFGEVLDAAEGDELHQSPIIEGKVWSVLADSIKQGVPFVLRKPFVVGFMADQCETDDNGMYVPGDETPIVSVSGGRHRATAIYTLLKLSKYSDEEIRNAEVVVLPEVYENKRQIAQAVRDDNSSRSIAPTEKLGLKLQELEIDLSDEGLAEAQASKELNTSELVGAYVLKLRSAYVAGEVADEDGEVIELHPLTLQLGNATLIKLVQTAVAQASKNLRGAAKQLLKQPEGLQTMVDIALSFVGDALDNWAEYAKKNPSKDVMNYQRNAAKVVSSILTDIVESFTATFEDVIRKQEDEKKQKRAEALTKAREANKSKADSGKKSAPPSTSKGKATKSKPPVQEVEDDEEIGEDEEEVEEVAPAKFARGKAKSSKASAPAEVKKAVLPSKEGKAPRRSRV